MTTLRGVRAFACGQVLLLLFLAAAVPQTALGQSPPVPTADQLETFRNLPPDQQRAVLDAMGRTSGAGQRKEAPLSNPPITQPADTAEPAPTEPEEGPVRIDGGVTLVLEVTAEEPENEPDRAALLRSRRDRILAGNPYEVDAEGGLLLPFLPRIQLRGLTAQEAEQRLNTDPRLAGLLVKVTVLPVEPMGAAALKPFGYNVFREVPTTFAPATDIPVPPDYTIGPGDNIIVQLSGKRTERYELVVDRAGRLNLPEFGPVQVAGSSFDRVRSDIEQRVSNEMIGVRATVSAGELRSIRVLVLGDVVRPGSYTVSSLSTVTHALFTSGGISEVGSLRNVEVKRAGVTIGKLDLYDLLLRGDSSQDIRLQSGDVVFVPPVGVTAAIDGRVRRPAIYEVREGAKVSDLLELSGGLAPDAAAAVAKLERITADDERVVLNVDLTSAAGRDLVLRSGDVLTVPRVLDDVYRAVTLEGHVMRPGRYAWHEGMRLTDLLGSLRALKINADQRYLLIRRVHMPDRRVEVLSADAIAAFAARGTDADPLLASRDRIIVFDMQSDRGAALADVIKELQLQTRDHQPIGLVWVTGRVRAPGQYPLEEGMTVSDLLRAGGGLDEAAYALSAELTRLQVVDGEMRETEVSQLDLAEVLAGNASADVLLHPYDRLVIKETPDWSEQGTVRMLGEVRFPGEYPIRKGETLSSVLKRAGGLTDYAFSEGSILTREEIKRQEREQLDNLVRRLQSDLSVLALQGAQMATDANQNPAQALAVGQSLLTQLQNAKPTGRLVINLDQAIKHEHSDADIQLRTGDTLIVPPLRQYVTIIGEVQNPTSHVWRRDLTRDDYLRMSGGTTDKADTKRIYVVRANGSVVTDSGSRWFSKGNVEMRPGDTIVVPLDTERMRPLPLWTAVTTIIYNLAVAVAAIGSF